jgi:uncharacterized protein YkwD
MRCTNPFLGFLVCSLAPWAATAQAYYADPVPNVEYSEWNDPRYQAADAARDADYLTSEEKKVFFYLNQARMNPPLFAATYLDYLKSSTDYYERSLCQELQQMKPLPVLEPDRRLFESANCHATDSGERGYIGHDRAKCQGYFMGECCHYGNSDALDIVVKLLIDRNVPSLGHRRICLGNYTRMGVSIRPHTTFGKNAVLDFE